jgi:hypothetical protein
MNSESLSRERVLQLIAKSSHEHGVFSWENYEAWLHEQGFLFLHNAECLEMEGDALRRTYGEKNVAAWGVLLRGGRDTKPFPCVEAAISAKEYFELQGYPAEVFPIVSRENLQ